MYLHEFKFWMSLPISSFSEQINLQRKRLGIRNVRPSGNTAVFNIEFSRYWAITVLVLNISKWLISSTYLNINKKINKVSDFQCGLRFLETIITLHVLMCVFVCRRFRSDCCFLWLFVCWLYPHHCPATSSPKHLYHSANCQNDCRGKYTNTSSYWNEKSIHVEGFFFTSF